MRRLALIAALIAAGITGLAATASGDDSHTYFIELDNAFGLTTGSEVKIAGVTSGTVEQLLVNNKKRAVIKVQLSGPLSRLGEDTICSSQPQSLIAEYFIDCQPKGPPLTEGTGSDDERINNPDIPVSQTRQTVQNDLVQSGLRLPFSQRLTLLINEFGTALAGNPEDLNSAIRRGAPALTQARKVTKILASQNRIIRDLNVNSDTIVAKLNARSQDVVRFVRNARDTGAAAAERSTDLSRNFAILDDFLAQLRPTMSRLNTLAVTQTPLLQDLRASAPGLNTLATNLPDFAAATDQSLVALGKASVTGKQALNQGRDEINQLGVAGRSSSSVAENLANFLQDIDDPKRAVETDARAARDTGRPAPTGYTGMEGLLNYAYYQPNAISQFDDVSHLLHFAIFEVGTGPCASYNAGPTVPSKSGGETTSATDAARCVSWVGKNQPGINQDVSLPPYDPSVCSAGSTDLSICDPNGGGTTTSANDGLSRSAGQAKAVREAAAGSGSDAGSAPSTGGNNPGGGGSGGGGNSGANSLPGLGAIPGLGGNGSGGSIRDQVPGGLGKQLPGAAGSPRTGRSAGGQGGSASADATRDLFGYLMGQ